MRIIRAGLAACALIVAGGCLGDGGTVMIMFDQQMAVTPTVTGFNASNATANDSDDGFVHFTATSSQGTLTMLIVPPIHAGDMIDMGMGQHNASYREAKFVGCLHDGLRLTTHVGVDQCKAIVLTEQVTVEGN